MSEKPAAGQISALPPRTCIYINSNGGDVEAAIGIGRLIRRMDLETAVGSYYLNPQKPAEHIVPRIFAAGKCISAATLIFLGGRLRHFNSSCSFGVHQFSFPQSTQEQVEKSQRLSASIARYIEEMGISAAFMEVSADKPGHEVTFLSEAQLNELKVVTGGATEANWKVEMHEEVAYVKGERDTIFGYGKVMLGWAEADGFLFMSMIETMGREDELLNFGLVEIALGEEEEAINISDRCARMPVGSNVMTMAKISFTEAQMIAESSAIGIRIRMSPESPVFLGISPISTAGGESKLKGFIRLMNKR